jgi:hypothetical protein
MEASFTALKHMKKNTKEIKNEYDVEGLNEIITEYENLKDSSVYKELVESFIKHPKEIRESGVLLTEEEKEKRRFLKAAREVLSDPPTIYFLRKGMVTLLEVYAMHRFIEVIYYMNIGRKLKHEDVLKYSLSILDEYIAFALDRFNEVTEVPEPTNEFFIKLKNVEWKDKKTKKFFDKIRKIRSDAIQYIFWSDFSMRHSKFLATESYFLLFLADCSAVNNGKEKITEKDIIRAYKTYFKLIKTDLPALIEKLE